MNNSSQEVSDTARRTFWRVVTRRLAFQINLGWWLALWMPVAAVIGLISMIVLLYTRWAFPDYLAVTWSIIGGTFVASASGAWFYARHKFESQESAQVRLEDSLGLQSQLTTASDGIGTWPSRTVFSHTHWPVTWRWQQPLGILTFISLMLILATIIPIAHARPDRNHRIERPTDVRVVEQWIEHLEEENLIEEKSIDTLHDKIQHILDQPKQDWYEHASLEAAGTLREQTEAQLRDLTNNVAHAMEAAAALQSMEQQFPESLRTSLLNEFTTCMNDLSIGTMQPSGDLQQLMHELQITDIQQLSPEQRTELAKRLAQNHRRLMDALASCHGFDMKECDGWCDECSGGKPCGQCEGCTQSKTCNAACTTCGRSRGTAPGQGGINRGRADADMTFGQDNNLATTAKERIDQPLDLGRASADDILSVVDGAFQVDESAYRGPQSGGTITTPGNGGSSVEVNSLLPSEQSTVKRFFQ